MHTWLIHTYPNRHLIDSHLRKQTLDWFTPTQMTLDWFTPTLKCNRHIYTHRDSHPRTLDSLLLDSAHVDIPRSMCPLGGCGQIRHLKRYDVHVGGLEEAQRWVCRKGREKEGYYHPLGPRHNRVCQILLSCPHSMLEQLFLMSHLHNKA